MSISREHLAASMEKRAYKMALIEEAVTTDSPEEARECLQKLAYITQEEEGMSKSAFLEKVKDSFEDEGDEVNPYISAILGSVPVVGTTGLAAQIGLNAPEGHKLSEMLRMNRRKTMGQLSGAASGGGGGLLAAGLPGAAFGGLGGYMGGGGLGAFLGARKYNRQLEEHNSLGEKLKRVIGALVGMESDNPDTLRGGDFSEDSILS